MNWSAPLLVLALWAVAARAESTTAALPLSLDPASAHDLAVASGPALTELRTTGHDPFAATLPFAAPAGGQTVLSFEYIAIGGVPALQVYVGMPWHEARSLTAEVPHSEGWTTFALDLHPVWPTAAAPPNRLRIDFGRDPGRVIQIRNLHLRAPNARERDADGKLAAKRAAEQQLDRELQSYLERTFPAQITRVTVDHDTVAIAGRVPPGAAQLGLSEVEIWEDDLPSGGHRTVAPIANDGGSFALRLPRYAAADGVQRDRLLSRWRIVRRDSGEPLSALHYADEVAARSSWPEKKPRSKKGLGGFTAGKPQAVSDLDALGIDNVTVNLFLSRCLRAKPSAQTFTASAMGRTLYLNRPEIEKLDATLQAAAKRDARVFAILLVGKSGSWDGDLGATMQHPDCDPAGVYSMANVTSAEGVGLYAALLDFLAERYSRPGAPYGRIHHWIVHNEVDAGWVWTNCGEKPPVLFMDQYHKSMRIAHLIARQYDPHARAYISLTHYWTWTANHRFTPSRQLLEHLLAFSRVEGDFDWGIAFHPYPESLREPKTWLDRKVDFTYGTPLITFKNLEVLDAWVREPAQRFRGQTVRSVNLTEQGPNSPDYSERALREQAASLAYVWQKLRRLDAIESFEFHNWADSRGEGGLRIGLRRFPDDPEAPLAPKPVWHVYRALDTPDESAAIAFALPVIGVQKWDEVPYRAPIPAHR